MNKYFNDRKKELLMTRKLAFIGFIFLMILPQILFSQSVRKLIKDGDKAFEENDFYSSSELYEKAFQVSPIEEAIYKWALSEYHKRNYSHSLALFEQVSLQNPSKYPLCNFYIGLNYKSLGKYQKANQYFHKYYKAHRKNRDYYTLKAKQEILSTEKAFDMSLSQDSILLTLVDSLSESRYSELLFRAVAPNQSYLVAKRPLNRSDSLFSTRLFLVKSDTIQALDTNINYPFFNLNGFCFVDLQNIIVSACSRINGIDQCLMYRSSKSENGLWSVLEKLPLEINLPEASNIHPYFFKQQDKSYLLFASNSKEGEGGFDIYYSEFKDGHFKKAENFGKRINSIDNEISPIYDTLNKKLFFSSEWFYNNGGYDIFYSEGEFPEVDVPVNMGQPINSSYDDLFFNWSYDYQTAYLSSNRLNAEAAQSESCCNDIFQYQLPEIKKDTVIDTLILAKKIDQMQQLIPIDLFFDNDRPNPKTMDTITHLTYEETYETYFRKLNEYETQFSEGLKKEAKDHAVAMIDDFFYQKVESGFDQLKAFNFLLIKLLREGYEIELTVKGFASPLNNNQYNVNLSKRRVSSIINYYRTVEDGIYNEYITGKTAKGRLTIKEEAFGEVKASKTVSDDRLDTRNSIYSPWAAEERRVQLIAFRLKNRMMEKSLLYDH